MSRNLEDMIRGYGRAGDAPSPPPPPTDRCLSFEQAEGVAREAEGAADGELPRHAAACPRCARLVADFREALAEGEPAQQADEAPAPARRFLGLTYRWVAWAAAASILALVGASALFLATRLTGAGAMLADAQVALKEETPSDLTPKGVQTFASLEQIVFRVRLRRPAHVMLLGLDPKGVVTAHPPQPGGGLCVPVRAGDALLGPYRLDDTTGLETYLVVAARRPVADVPARVRELQAAYDEHRNVETLVERVRSWPAEVLVIRFQHIPSR